jgi:hypothetical protein
MALTMQEIELETIELLPSREVMTGGPRKKYHDCGCSSDNYFNLLSGNVIQVGLWNGNYQDF